MIFSFILTEAMLAKHTHSIKLGIQDGYVIARHSNDLDPNPRYGNTGSTGSNNSHTHSFSGSSSHSHNITVNLKYINVIVCSKN